jgi:hypothetical protein
MKRQMSKTKKEPQARDWWNLGLNTITGFTVNHIGKRDKEATKNYNANRKKNSYELRFTPIQRS